MADLIEIVLKQLGPSLSSEVAAEVARRANISPAAARQRLSRVTGKVRKLAGITFPRNARFLYLEQDFGSSSYWSRLADALIATNSALGYAIAGLKQCDGMVPARNFPIICGAPLRQLKHLAPETILLHLTEAGLVKTVGMPGVGECIALTQEDSYYFADAAEMRARLITEDILLSAVRDWLRKLGIASYNLVKMRDAETLPQVGTFVWDLSAPSYLGHMVRYSGGESKPGFVVCDVNLTKSMTIAGVMPFVRKCLTLRALRKVGPCMQILVANRFDKEAFVLLRRHGIIAATPANLFGSEIADALNELTSVLANAASSLFDTERFEELFSTLGKIHGATNQLRGTLFEYLAAKMAERNGLGAIWMNRIFTAPDKRKAEVDIFALRHNHSITAVECKGYSPRATIPDDLFKRWLQYNVPVAYKAMRDHPDYKNLPIGFEFWSTAPVSEASLALYEKAKSELNESRYTITLRGPRDVIRLCRQTYDQSLIDAFEKHFMLEDGTIPPDGRPPKALPSPSFEDATEEEWDV